MRKYVGRYAVSITKYPTVLEVVVVDYLGRTIRARSCSCQSDADRVFYLFCEDCKKGVVQ